MKIGIIDYGVGNVRAISNALRLIGQNSQICESPSLIERNHFNLLILPGVGSFDYAATQLKSKGFSEVISEHVLNKEISLLGICLGMQLLLDGSDEGNLDGLSLISGKARKFDFADTFPTLPVPHMGWSTFQNTINGSKFLHLKLVEKARFYFAHSYYAELNSESDILSTTSYGIDFPSIIGSNNICGFQFHPEKSSKAGLMLMDNYLKNLANNEKP